MYTLIANVAVARVPKPVPVVVETIRVKRPHRGGPKPGIVVDAGRYGTVGLVTDGLAPLEAQPLRHVELADNTLAQELHGLNFVLRGAALHANLHHAVVLACRF